MLRDGQPPQIARLIPAAETQALLGGRSDFQDTRHGPRHWLLGVQALELRLQQARPLGRDGYADDQMSPVIGYANSVREADGSADVAAAHR